MSAVVIDTCVWVNFAEIPPLYPLLLELSNCLKSESYRLVIPESVEIEFDRKRTNAGEKWARNLDKKLTEAKSIATHVNGLDSALAQMNAAVSSAISAAKKNSTTSFNLIDELFSTASHLKIDSRHYEEACRKCLKSLTPAHKTSRSSVGDCLLWSAIVDLLDSTDVWFCTENTIDFANPKQHAEPHPSLVEEIAKKKHRLNFYSDPNLFVTALRQEVAASIPAPEKNIPRYSDYATSPHGSCPRCGSSSLTAGAYLRSQYGGLTLQQLCTNCGLVIDTGDSFD